MANTDWPDLKFIVDILKYSNKMTVFIRSTNMESSKQRKESEEAERLARRNERRRRQRLEETAEED